MKKLRKFLEKFFLIDDTPHKIAAGAAMGVFWGIMPGEGILTTLVTASLFRLNRLSATAGVLAVNMWTTFVILPLAAITGGFIFRTDAQNLIDDFQKTYHLGIRQFFTETIFLDLFLPLIVGFIIVSLAISLGLYFLLYFVLKYKKIRFK